MSPIAIVSIVSGIAGFISAIVGTWYTLRSVNIEKAKSEFERGRTCEQIEHHRESIVRAFNEIDRIKEDHKSTSNNVITIMANIEYIKDSMSEMKTSIKNIENTKCKEK